MGVNPRLNEFQAGRVLPETSPQSQTVRVWGSEEAPAAPSLPLRTGAGTRRLLPPEPFPPGTPSKVHRQRMKPFRRLPERHETPRPQDGGLQGVR
jgi:hypothetical protein